jgi:four helix bundle protein
MSDLYDSDRKYYIKEIEKKYDCDLKERLLHFAVDIIRFLFLLPLTKELEVFRLQLSKSSTSIGANYEESQAGTYNEFKNRIQICLRESKETNYFLNVLKKLKLEDTTLRFKNKVMYISELDRLVQESDEIKKIFGAISSKTRIKKD